MTNPTCSTEREFTSDFQRENTNPLIKAIVTRLTSRLRRSEIVDNLLHDEKGQSLDSIIYSLPPEHLLRQKIYFNAKKTANIERTGESNSGTHASGINTILGNDLRYYSSVTLSRCGKNHIKVEIDSERRKGSFLVDRNGLCSEFNIESKIGKVVTSFRSEKDVYRYVDRLLNQVKRKGDLISVMTSSVS